MVDRRQEWETGDRRREAGVGRQETGDGRQEWETGDRRRETVEGIQKKGDGRQETGHETGDRRRETEDGRLFSDAITEKFITLKFQNFRDCQSITKILISDSR